MEMDPAETCRWPGTGFGDRLGRGSAVPGLKGRCEGSGALVWVAARGRLPAGVEAEEGI
jgi:hypothetical protein